MTHFDKHNPWADSIIYVSLSDWLDCLDVQDQREHYARHAQARPVDCYILPQPSGYHSMGMRYGKDGPEYYSPTCNRMKAQQIIDREHK